MITLDLKAEARKAADENDAIKMLAFALLSGFYYGEEGFEKTCYSLWALFFSIIHRQEKGQPLTIEELTQLVELIRSITANDMSEELTKIGYYEAIKTMSGIIPITKVIVEINKFNAISPIIVDYRWFFPELHIEVASNMITSFYHEEKGFEDSCANISFMFDFIIRILETEPTLTIEELTQFVELIRSFATNEMSENLTKIDYYQAIKKKSDIIPIAKVIVEINKFNAINPIKVDYRWFFPSLEIEDLDVLSNIISQIFECLGAVKLMEDNLQDSIYLHDEYNMSNWEDYDPIYSQQQIAKDEKILSNSPSALYNSLLGMLPSGEIYTIAGADTFFELWFRQDFDNLIETITWGTDIPLPNLLDITIGADKPNTEYERKILYFKYHLSRLLDIRKVLVKLNGDDALNYHRDIALMRVAFIEEILSYLIYKTPIEKNREEARIQLVERNRILSNLSHSIKNMLRSVIDPLINLREEFPQKANVIDNAIKGAHLIREIVNSINLSYETNIEDISWDITHPDAESITLQEMLLNSLKYSIGNMFDFRYFPQYAENYYPRSIPKDDFDSIKAEWNAVSSVHDFEPLVAFAEKHLCKLSVNLSEAAQYTLGNEKSSAIKLMIMFQEIIFNAVKYASFVPRAERFLEIRLDNTETTIRFEVINSYRPEVRAKTTGVGKLVIENFSKVLGTDPEIKKTDSTYSIYIEFNNLWRNNAQDTVH